MTYEKIMSNIIGDIMRSMEPPHKNRQQQQNTTITLAYSMLVDQTHCSGSDMYHGILKTYICGAGPLFGGQRNEGWGKGSPGSGRSGEGQGICAHLRAKVHLLL